MSTLTPPSSSSNDCEADESDCAPSRGVKLNMLAVWADLVKVDSEHGHYDPRRASQMVKAEAEVTVPSFA